MVLIGTPVGPMAFSMVQSTSDITLSVVGYSDGLLLL